MIRDAHRLKVVHRKLQQEMARHHDALAVITREIVECQPACDHPDWSWDIQHGSSVFTCKVCGAKR